MAGTTLLLPSANPSYLETTIAAAAAAEMGMGMGMGLPWDQMSARLARRRHRGTPSPPKCLLLDT